MVGISGPCERCRCHCQVSWNIDEPRPRLHLCEQCAITVGLEEIVSPRWFGAQIWCWLTTRHEFVYRTHHNFWQSKQCTRCGSIHIDTHPDVRRRIADREFEERQRLAADADPEYAEARKELRLIEGGKK